jgi:hypothetical protein
MDGVAPAPKTGARKLRDLAGVGPSIEANLHRLGIRTMDELARADAMALYRGLEKLERCRPDPCVLDTLRCAVAQARDPHLPDEQRNWWWWSRERKAGR